jgi:hypothetical protein
LSLLTGAHHNFLQTKGQQQTPPKKKKMNILRRVKGGGYHQKLEDESGRKGPLFNFKLGKTKHTKKARGDSTGSLSSTMSMSVCSDFPSTDILETRNGSLLKKAREHSAAYIKNNQSPAVTVEGPAGRPAHRRFEIPKPESARFLSKPCMEGKGLNDFLTEYDSIVEPELSCAVRGTQSVTGW